MLGLSVTLMITSSDPELSLSVKLILNLKVPVMLGVPETTPEELPVKKEGRFAKVNSGAMRPLTLKRT